MLAPFVDTSTSAQIPFVFLPLKDQIIYPDKEISLTGKWYNFRKLTVELTIFSHFRLLTLSIVHDTFILK